MNQIDGIGRPRIRIDTIDGTRNILDVTLMLTQQGGYKRQMPEESFIQRLMSLDLNDKQITELKVKTGFWNIFTFSWQNFPLPLAQVKYIIQILNNDRPDLYKITLWPKWPYPFGESAAGERVNYIGGGIEFNNSDNSSDLGTYGVVLIFKSYQTSQNIYILDPTISIGGGEFMPQSGSN